MKKKIKETAKLMPIIFLILFIIYLAFSHPAYWQTTAIVAVVLMTLVQLLYKPFSIINVDGKYVFEFGKSNLKKDIYDIEKLKKDNKRLSDRISALTKITVERHEYQKQLDDINSKFDNVEKKLSHKQDKVKLPELTFPEMMQNYWFVNNLDDFNKTDEPIGVNSFQQTVDYAKKSNQLNTENYYYSRIVDKYSESYAYHFINKIKGNCDPRALKKVEPYIYKSVKRPYDESALLSAKNDLANDDNKTQLTYEFNKLMKNLNMLY